jgi:hypothetical protein
MINRVINRDFTLKSIVSFAWWWPVITRMIIGGGMG